MVIDIQTLRDSADDDPELAEELLNLFDKQAHAEMEHLADAARRADAALIASIAHKLVGSVIACGFVSLAEELRSLELLCRSEMPENIEERIERLRFLFKESLAGMTDLMVG